MTRRDLPLDDDLERLIKDRDEVFLLREPGRLRQRLLGKGDDRVVIRMLLGQFVQHRGRDLLPVG